MTSEHTAMPARARTHRALLTALGAMMFLQFFVWGSWFVSITGWLNATGLSGLTALVYSVGPLAAIVSPLLLGRLADRVFATERVLAVAHLAGAAFMLLIPLLAGEGKGAGVGFLHPLILLLMGHALCYMPTLGLINTVCFRHLEEPERLFPIVRAAGTLGWIAGGVAVTLLPEGDRSAGQFYLAGGAGVALALLTFTLPATPPQPTSSTPTVREMLGMDALRLLRDRSFLVFVICMFLLSLALAAYYQQARNFVEDAGIARPTLTMSLGQVSEVFCMLVLPVLLLRYGIKPVLLMGIVASLVRYALFAVAALLGAPALIVGSILLHGICYDFAFIAGQIYVGRKAPEEIRAQAQGLFVLVTQGLGMLVGAFLCGWLVTTYGMADGSGVNWLGVWLWPALALAATAVLFVLKFQAKPIASAPKAPAEHAT